MNYDGKKIKSWFWLYLLPALIFTGWAAYKFSGPGPERRSDEYSDFTSSEGELSPPPAGTGRAPRLPPDGVLQVRYRRGSSEDYSPVMPPEEKRPRPEPAAAASASGPGGAGMEDRSSSAGEQAFVNRHKKAIKSYQKYLSSLGRKYRGKYPALRAMDAEFRKMPRYAALNRAYARDRNPYKWARGVMALPEVKSAIVKYCRNPQVAKGMIELSLEALRNPPPREIYSEILNFLSSDAKTSKYVSELTRPVAEGAAMALPELDPGTDFSPLTKLGDQIIGGRPPQR